MRSLPLVGRVAIGEFGRALQRAFFYYIKKVVIGEGWRRRARASVKDVLTRAQFPSAVSK